MSAVSDPSGTQSDPFQIVSGHLGKVIRVLEAVGLSLEGVRDISREVLELSPDERFTESAKIISKRVLEPSDLDSDVRAELADQFDGDVSDVMESLLPMWIQTMEGHKEQVQRDILDLLVKSRENDLDALAMAVFVERWLGAFETAYEQQAADGNLKLALSVTLALNSRFLEIVENDVAEFSEEFLRDIVRSDYYLDRIYDESSTPHPDTLSKQEIEGRIRLHGAVLAYQQRDISLNRGAELAGISRSQFEGALLEAGSQPRHGPVDEPLFDENEPWF